MLVRFGYNMLALTLLLGGCSGGASSSDGAGGAGGGAPCPTGEGPAMVSVGEFCIDSTEVTAEQYARFLIANPVPASQPEVCSWNTSFLPDNGEYCDFGAYDPVGHPRRPAVCMDWCDAHAYCQWAGKRLCGRTGGNASELNDYFGMDNEWTFACTSGGQYTYAYGSQYQPDTCYGKDSSKCGEGQGDCLPRDVGSLPQCASPKSPFSGIQDLSGNVGEWENSCEGVSGLHDTCRFRGGSLAEDALYLQCAPPSNTFELVTARGGVSQGIGIRCCADSR